MTFYQPASREKNGIFEFFVRAVLTKKKEDGLATVCLASGSFQMKISYIKGRLRLPPYYATFSTYD